MREDRQGRIWIGTDDGLFLWESGKIRPLDNRDGVPAISVHAIYQDRAQRLWVGGYHFFRLDGDRMTEIHLPGALTDNVKSIIETRDGTLWVGTVTGLQRSNAALSTAAPVFTRIPNIHSTVRTLLEDDDGALWIGTIGEGLIRYQNGHFDPLPASMALPSNTILSSFPGSGHNVWIGTQAGLVRLNKTAASTFALPDFADADFGTISADRDGALWVSSTHLFRLAAGRAEMQQFSGPLANVRIRNVFRDNSGTLWFGTEGKGAFRWVHGVPRQIPETQPYIRAFAEDHAGGVWIGTDGGYCRWLPSGTRCFEAARERARAFCGSARRCMGGQGSRADAHAQRGRHRGCAHRQATRREGMGHSRRCGRRIMVWHAHQRAVSLERRPTDGLHYGRGTCH